MKTAHCILLLLFILLPASAVAHKSSDSYLSLILDGNGKISGRWDIALRDLDVILPVDANDDRRITWGEMQRSAPLFQDLVQTSLHLRTGTTPCTMTTGMSMMAIDEHVDGRYLVMNLQGKCGGAGALYIDYLLLNGVDASHRGIARISIKNTDHAILLTPGREVRIADDTRARNWLGYVQEGMHHIATGYDHLLFLLSLLLPVALVRPASTSGQARSAWRDTVTLVTAFTVSHSLTLGLATFNLVHLPSRLVESTIAASVMIAALHNLRKHNARTRWKMALVFGLVHGLGFAAMLGELPTATSERLQALAGFNLGVEAGQLLAVAAFLPLAIALARKNQLGYRRWGLQGGSLFIAALAFVWLCQRLFQLQIIPG